MYFYIFTPLILKTPYEIDTKLHNCKETESRPPSEPQIQVCTVGIKYHAHLAVVMGRGSGTRLAGFKSQLVLLYLLGV